MTRLREPNSILAISSSVGQTRWYAAISARKRSVRMSRSKATSITSDVDELPSKVRACAALVRSSVMVIFSLAIPSILPTGNTTWHLGPPRSGDSVP